MIFINPFDLLEIDSTDSEAIKKAKKRKLADIQINEGFLDFGDQKVSKSDFLRLVDELDDNKKKEFYWFIKKDVNLSKFLTNSDIAFFYLYQPRKEYKNADFITFVSPYFSESFNNLLLKAFKTGNAKIIYKLFSVPILVNQEYTDKLYKSVSKLLYEILEKLNNIHVANDYIDDDISDIENFLKSIINIELLNVLPDYFQKQRNDIAKEIKRLSIECYNFGYAKTIYKSTSYQCYYNLICYAQNLKLDGSVKISIEKEFEESKEIIQNLKQEEKNNLIFEKWHQVLLKIIELTKDIDNTNINNISEKIKNIFSIGELNILPNSFIEIKCQVALSLRNLSVAIWNKTNNSYISLDVLSLAQNITVDKETSGLLSENYSDLMQAIQDYKKHKEHELIIEKIVNIFEKINALIEQTDKKSINISSTRKSIAEIKSSINIAEINALSLEYNDLRNKLALILRALSVSIYNNFDDVDSAIDILKYAKLIHVEQDVTKILDESYKQLEKIIQQNKKPEPSSKSKKAEELNTSNLSKETVKDAPTEKTKNESSGCLTAFLIGIFSLIILAIFQGNRDDSSRTTNNTSQYYSTEQKTERQTTSYSNDFIKENNQPATVSNTRESYNIEQTITYSDGGKYIGEVKNGKRNGYGTFTGVSGDQYTGEWVNDLQEGNGIVTYPNGSKYEGQWKNGNPDGKGTITYADGSKYVGELKRGKRQGVGTHTGVNGGQYSGDWKSDIPEGHGEIIYADGSRYIGDIKNNKQEGKGTFYFTNGNTYFGEFKNDNFEGNGTLLFTNGDKYVGELKNGKRHGEGTLFIANGAKYTGDWKDDIANGHGEISYADGSKYIGDIKNNKQEGKGTFYFANGNTYFGEFKNDIFEGNGTLAFTNGDKYVGEFRNGVFDGQGTATSANGYQYTGEWKNGAPVDKQTEVETYTQKQSQEQQKAEKWTRLKAKEREKLEAKTRAKDQEEARIEAQRQAEFEALAREEERIRAEVQKRQTEIEAMPHEKVLEEAKLKTEESTKSDVEIQSQTQKVIEAQREKRRNQEYMKNREEDEFRRRRERLNKF